MCEWLTDTKAKLAEMSLIVTEREAKAKARIKDVCMTVMLRKKSGEVVIVKKPGLTGKMLSKREGPYLIMEKLSPLTYSTYAVSIPGRKRNAILHTNLLKPFHTPIAQVHGIAVVEDDGLHSLPGM